MSLDERVLRVAARQYGIFTRHQAIALGFTKRQIEGRLARGLWMAVHRGVYAVAGVPLSFEARVLAAVFAAGPGACASHTSAGVLWRFDAIVCDMPVVSAVGRPRRHIPGVVAHDSRSLAARDITKLGIVPVTTPGRTLLDLAAVLESPALEDALDCAIRRDLVNAAGLRRRLAAMDARGRPGVPVLRQLLDDRVGANGSGSRLENMVWRVLVNAGLPRPVRQYEIHGEIGDSVARVDFAYPDSRIAIEVDGYEFHSKRTDWERDLVRQNKIAALGWLVLRTTKRQIDEHPGEFIAAVRRRLTTRDVVNLRQSR